MKQGLLFSNLPTLEAKTQTKAETKALAERAKQMRKSAGGSGPLISIPGDMKARNRFAARLQAAVAAARQTLVPEDWMELVTDETRFRNYMRLARLQGYVALDTETTGLDPIADKIVGLCAYYPGEKSIYVPINHTDLMDNLLPNQIPQSIIQEELALFQGVAGPRLIFHNAKFDIRVLRNSLEVFLTPYWCTSIAGNFLNENEPHKLKFLYDKYVMKKKERDSQTFSELFDGIPFNYVPPEVGYIYACRDPRYTLELFQFQEPFLTPGNPLCKESDLEEAAVLMRDYEFPLITHLADMEDRGITLSIEKADVLTIEAKGIMKEALERCYTYFKANIDINKVPLEKRAKLGNPDDGGPINIGSSTQLAVIVFDVWKMDNGNRDKPRSCDEEALLYLSSHSQHAKFFKDILEYRGQQKLISTYVEKMPGIAKRILYIADKAISGIINCSFNQYGAKTGRFSSSDPNLQNIPRDGRIRAMFVAREGFVLVGADYSQQEPRVLADRSGDELMIQAYKDGRDLYSWIASIVYKVDYDECKEFRADGSKNPEGKKRRQAMKSVVLGLMYGRGAKAISEELNITDAEAKDIINMFFTSFPKVKAWIESIHAFVIENGFVKTAWGRKRRLPEAQMPEYEYEMVQLYDGDGDPIPMPSEIEAEALFGTVWNRLKKAWGGKQKRAIKDEVYQKYGMKIHDNGGKIADALRQSVNSIIQGSSADITKKAMLAVGEDKQMKAWGFHMLITAHDEIIGEAPVEHARKCAKRMEELMIGITVGHIKTPMKVDAEITECWGGPDITDTLAA